MLRSLGDNKSLLTPSSTIAQVDVGIFAQPLEQLMTIVKTIAGVDSVWLHGSRVAGTAIEASDLDVAICVAQESFTTLKHELAVTFELLDDFPEYFDFSKTQIWLVGEREIGIHIFTPDQIEDRINRAYCSIEEYEQFSGFIQHVIIHSEPLYQSDTSQFGTWIKRALNFPVELQQELTEKYLLLLSQKCMWWRVRPNWKNIYEEVLDHGLLLDEVSKCQYALNGHIHMPGLKDYHRDIQFFIPDIQHEMTDFIFLSRETTPCKERRHLVSQMVKKLYESYQERFSAESVERKRIEYQMKCAGLLQGAASLKEEYGKN